MALRRNLLLGSVVAALVLSACSDGGQEAAEVPTNPYADRTVEPVAAAPSEPSPSPSDRASADPAAAPPGPSEEGPITDPYAVVDLSGPVVAPEDDWLGLATVDELQQSNEWSDQAAYVYFGENTGDERAATDTSLPETPRRRWSNQVELWNSLAPVWREDLMRIGPSYRKPLFEGMPAQWLGGGNLWGEEHLDGAGAVYSWSALIESPSGSPLGREYAALIKTQADGSGEVHAVMPPFSLSGDNDQAEEEALQRIWRWASEISVDPR